MNELTNIFKGTPDARQAETKIEVSRFRPKYRALDESEKALHDAIKDKAVELENLFNQIKDGRYKALAFTSLEESIMWIVKQLTAWDSHAPRKKHLQESFQEERQHWGEGIGSQRQIAQEGG